MSALVIKKEGEPIATGLTKDLKEGYVVVSQPASAPVDVKAQVPPIFLTAGSGARARGVLRGNGKKGLLKLTVPYSISMSAAATGLCNSTLSVTPDSNTSEWGSLANLYDEYRVTGGEFDFFVFAQPPATTAAGLSSDNMFAMVYDPVDATALVSVRNAMEYKHVHLWCPSMLAAGATNSLTATYGYRSDNGVPYKFRWTCTGDSALAIAAGAINYAPGKWKSILAAGSNSPDGNIKVYSAFATAAAAYTALSGVMRVFMEFRTRK